MKKLVLLALVFVVVFAMPALVSAQYVSPITIGGYVIDGYGNALSGLDNGVVLRLWQADEYAGKTNWRLVAETSCVRYELGNGCPDQWSGYYQFDRNSYGYELWPGTYKVQAGGQKFGWQDSEEFYVRDYYAAQNFTLKRLPMEIGIDTGDTKITGDNLVIKWASWSNFNYPVAALRRVHVTVEAHPASNAKEKDLGEVGDNGETFWTVLPQWRDNQKMVVLVKGLSELEVGRRVCVDMSLIYAGDQQVGYELARTIESTCFEKGFEGGWFAVGDTTTDGTRGYTTSGGATPSWGIGPLGSFSGRR